MLYIYAKLLEVALFIEVNVVIYIIYKWLDKHSNNE